MENWDTWATMVCNNETEAADAITSLLKQGYIVERL